MRHVDFEGSNMTLRAPPETPEVEPLAVAVRVCRGHGPHITSVWKPEPEEIEALCAGGFICLHVLSSGHPAVALDVRTPEGLKLLAEKCDG